MMATDFRVFYVSDLHLSERVPVSLANWDLCLDAMAEEKPDLVIVGGDLVFEDPDNEADWLFARRQIERIPAPWRITPGNHDVGDALPVLDNRKPVTPERLAAWHARFDAGWWSVDAGGWKIVGLDNMLIGSDLPEEHGQEEFLHSQLSGWHGPVALFVHKPLCFDSFAETEIIKYVMQPPARHHLLGLFEGKDLRVISAGHCHSARDVTIDGIRTVWAPATYLTLSDNIRLPDTSAGWLTYAFAKDGVSIDFTAAAALPAIDFTRLIETYGTLQAVPEDVLRALGT